MNIRSATGSPMPNTTWVRPWLSAQRVHVDASVATSSSGVGTSAEVSDGLSRRDR